MGHHIYDRVYILGVDGAGNFFRQADTPSIDRIFASGAYNHFVLTANPTISAQCWGSLLHGVTPQAHRFTNGLVGDFPVPDDHPYPSVFKAAREYFPGSVLASVVGWDPINRGIIEQGLDMIKETGNDDEVCEKVCKVITENDPMLLFVQFDSVDSAGHRFGYGTEDYLRQINYVDGLIGKIYDTADKNGRLANTLIIVTADHGGTPDGNHGDTTDAEKYVSYYVSGESVIPGCFGETDIRDTASIIAFALGIPQPGNWSAKLPDGLFSDGISFPRASELPSDGTKRYSGRKALPTPCEEGKTLADFIKPEGLLCLFEFDGNALEKTGKCTVKTEGKLYYTEGFYGKGAVFDDCTLHCSPINAGTNDFTFCSWIKLSRNVTGKKQILFTTMAKENAPGIAFSIQNEDLICEMGLGDQTVFYSRPLPGNYDGNLFHFICSYDRSEDELCYYYDFTIDSDRYSEPKIPSEYALNGSITEIGNHSSVLLDDLMFFDHKLSDHEIDELQKYYEQI